MMKYIHFIINPVSGNAKHDLSITYLRSFFPRSDFRIEADYTKHKNHAVELTQKAIAASPDCIVACGGDGTINEVASLLVNTTIQLGILPVGSGNGLASNLKIPTDIEKAVELIKSGKPSAIDVGILNGLYFFSNAGIGVDAMIIKKYERSGKRTLINYIKATILSSFRYTAWETIATVDGEKINVTPLLFFVSNSNEMGYKMSLTPAASLNDGWLDLVIIPELGFFQKLLFGYFVLRHKTASFTKATHKLTKKISIQMPERIFTDIQIDGEHHNLKTNTIEIAMIEKGLQIISNPS